MPQESQEVQPQWFIAADGTVFQTWPPDPDNDRMKYVRYATSRRLELTDLYALDERLDRFQTSLDRRANALLLAVGIAVACVVVAWLVLPRFGVSATVSITVTVLAVLMVLVAGPIARATSGGGRTRFDQIFLDAGFESAVPTVLEVTEAQALIDTPGTAAGRRSSTEPA